jgi:MFS family permease
VIVRPGAVADRPTIVDASGYMPANTRPLEEGLGLLALVVLLGPAFMATATGFATLIAAPSIQAQLHLRDAAVQLVVAGYVVVYAAGLVAGGRLGDMYGRRRLLVVGVSVFTLASALAAVAPDQYVLIPARCLQGAGAALMYPQALALIRAHWPAGPALGRAMAAWGAVLGLASASSLLVAGLLIQADVGGLGWRAVFLVNVPIGAVMAALVRMLPKAPAGIVADLDLGGLAMLSIALAALVFALTMGREQGWPFWSWLAIGGAVVVAGLFVAHERRLAMRGRAPLIALELLGSARLAGWLATTLLLYGGQLSLWMLLSLYLQRGLGLLAVEAALVVAPSAVGLLVVSAASARGPVLRCGPAIAIGAVSLTASVAGLAALAFEGGVHPSWPGLVAFLSLAGGGFGLAIPALTTAALREVPEGHEGAGAGLVITVQQVAGALGVAASGVLFYGLLDDHFGYGSAFAGALALQLVLFAATAALGGALGRAS